MGRNLLPLVTSGFLVFCAYVLAAGAMTAADETFLREADAKLDQSLLGETEFKKCEMCLERAKGGERIPWLVVLARYHRVMEEQPAAGIERLLPVVLEKSRYEAWKSENTRAEREGNARWQADCRAAESARRPLPPKPRGPFADLPPPAEWAINRTNMCAVLELARLEVARGHSVEGLRIVDHVGSRFEGLNRILAGECAGDAMMTEGRWSKAVEFYEYALAGFASLASATGMLPEEYKPHKARIERELALAREKEEIEKYGLGYIRYRDARLRHKKEGHLVEAVLCYEDLDRDFSKTVYGEAGKAYAIETLLELAERPESVRREAVARTRKVLEEHQNRLAKARLAKVSEAALKRFEEAVNSQKDWMGRLEAVPVGKGALEEAHTRGQAFTAEREFGLYRGEVMIALADYAFRRELDPGKAEGGYKRLWDWLTRVETVDAELEAFQVPDKAKGVSRPPQEELKVDNFGNATRVAPAPTAIVNRKTCPWYLNDLREEAALSLGFLCFARGEGTNASAWYEKVTDLDSKTRYLQTKKEWNDVKRLEWGVDHGFLFAEPEELKCFEGRRRFAILVGDFYYCTERFDQARAIYRRLLTGEFGPMKPGATDYAQFGVAMCVFWLDGKTAAWPEYLKVLSRRSGTLTEDRAAFCAGNMALNLEDARIREQGLALLKSLANSGRKNSCVYKAMITYGRHLLDVGEEKEGIGYLAAVPKEAASYYGAARFFLERYRIRKKAGNDMTEEKKAPEKGS